MYCVLRVLKLPEKDEDWILRTQALKALLIKRDPIFFRHAFEMLENDPTHFTTLSQKSRTLYESYPARICARMYLESIKYRFDYRNRKMTPVRVPERYVKLLFGVEAEEIEGHPPIPPEPGGEAEE